MGRLEDAQSDFLVPDPTGPGLVHRHIAKLHGISSAVKQIAKNEPLDQTENRSVGRGRPTVACKVCGKEFSSQSGRYYHMVKHTGQYKMYCQMCDKGFMKTDEYNKHLVKHRKQIQAGMARM